MQISPTKFPDVMLLEPDVFHDERGFFYESFNQKKFNDMLRLSVNFVQDNHSYSIKNVFRGLHYQVAPMAQGKLVRVVSGKVFDVVVDIRKNSAYFSQWIGIELSAENRKQLWIPPGFAHGFVTLSNVAEVVYKTTEYYAPHCERVLYWQDNSINIEFPCSIDPDQMIVSSKDRVNALSLHQADLFIE